jgi:hypothetical protein
MSMLQIMDHTGHTTIDFSKADNSEAMQKFNELIGKGFTAAEKIGDGKFNVVRKFSPDADEIIMIPRLQGG